MQLHPRRRIPPPLRPPGQRADYYKYEGVEVDLSVDGEPITGMGKIEGAFRIFGLPLQFSQDCLSDLLLHAVLPLTQGGESAPSVPGLSPGQPLTLASTATTVSVPGNTNPPAVPVQHP